MAFSNDSLKEWDKKKPTKTNLKNQQIKKKMGFKIHEIVCILGYLYQMIF